MLRSATAALAATLTLAVAPAGAGAQTPQVAGTVQAALATPVTAAVPAVAQESDDSAAAVEIEPVPATAAPITVESGGAPATLLDSVDAPIRVVAPENREASTSTGGTGGATGDVAIGTAQPGPAGLAGDGAGPQDLGDPDEPLGEPADPVPAVPDDGGVGVPQPAAPGDEAAGGEPEGERPPAADDEATGGAESPAAGDDGDVAPDTGGDAAPRESDRESAPDTGGDAAPRESDRESAPDAPAQAPTPTATGGGETETLPFTGLGVGLLVLLGALCLTFGLAGWRLAAR